MSGFICFQFVFCIDFPYGQDNSRLIQDNLCVLKQLIKTTVSKDCCFKTTRGFRSYHKIKPSCNKLLPLHPTFLYQQYLIQQTTYTEVYFCFVVSEVKLIYFFIPEKVLYSNCNTQEMQRLIHYSIYKNKLLIIHKT